MNIDERIEAGVRVAGAAVHLKQAHARLHAARVSVNGLRALSGVPADIARELVELTTAIESVEWHIEQRIRGAQ